MRYFLSFLFIVGLIILAFILVLDGFHSTPTKPGQQLVTYANTDTQVELIVDGPINADQLHNELVMTVGSTSDQINLEQGYQGTIVSSANYTNNSSAYAEFLRALQFDGFAIGETGPKVDTNPQGYCATGSRYTYEILNGFGNVSQNFWSTSCGGLGTFQGDGPAIMNLFIAQFPDYNTITGSLVF